MTKQFSVHAHVKGKQVFQQEPTVQVKAENEAQAIERGRHMIKQHPLMNDHYSDNFRAVENTRGNLGIDS